MKQQSVCIFLLLTNAALLSLVIMKVMQQPNPDMLLEHHGISGSRLVLWQKVVPNMKPAV
jgi:hypothetical protein